MKTIIHMMDYSRTTLNMLKEKISKRRYFMIKISRRGTKLKHDLGSTKRKNFLHETLRGRTLMMRRLYLALHFNYGETRTF